MTIEQHSGFMPDAHVQEIDGDVLPYVVPLEPPDYLNHLSAPSKDNIDQREFDYDEPAAMADETLPIEVRQALAVADAKQKHLESLGWKPDRIRDLVGRNRALAMLAVRGIDVSKAFPLQESPYPRNESKDPTPEQEVRIDKLMDTIGISYEDAKNRVVG